MKTYIVLIPVDCGLSNARKACEMIENTKFSINNPNAINVIDKIMLELGIQEHYNIEVEPITEFMDRFNNEELNVDDYFISYVYA